MRSVLITTKTATKLALSFVLAAFFFSTLWLTIGRTEVISPDESANRFFAERVARLESIAVDEPLAQISDNGIAPRSTVSVDGRIVPTSFLGVPLLYGAIGSVFGSWIMPVLTSVLAVLGVLTWYGVMRKLFKDEWLAMLSAGLLMVAPAYWFYAGRSFMHNVPFLVFGILALWCVLVRPVKRVQSIPWNELFGGLLLGVAMMMRTGEVIWVTLLTAGLVLYVLVKKYWSVKQLIAFVCGGLVIVTLLGIVHYRVYGSPFESGYTIEPSYELQIEELPRPATEVVQDSYSGVLGLIFPFGFHERAILQNSTNYLVTIAPYLAALALMGGVFVLYTQLGRAKQSKQKAEANEAWRVFTLASIFITVWLVAVYGSWVFFDNSDRTLVTIGNSYMRYWLPIFLIWTPFIAHALITLVKTITRQSRHQAAILVLSFAVITILNGHIVFSGPDGFINARKTLSVAAEEKSLVLESTPESAVVIVDTEDKYLFPDRKVLQPLRSERTYALMSRIAKEVPLYYYGLTLPEKDLSFLLEEKLPPLGVTIEHVKTINDKSLYLIQLQ